MTAKLSETNELVLKTIRKNPDIATFELKPLLPALTSSQVHNAVSYLKIMGLIRISGRKTIPTITGHLYTHPTYTAKYTRRPAPEAPQAVSVVHETVIPHVDEKLRAAYERLAMLHTETMAELVEEKKKTWQCQSWWCRMKRWFA